MTTLLLDTHVLLWLGGEPERLSVAAAEAIDQAEQLAVATVTWFELAWLAEHGRILTSIPIRTWLSGLARDCLLYTSPSPRDGLLSRMPSSA